jgi:molecular chaperone Hsp33
MQPLRDELIRTTSADGSMSVRVLTSTNLVRDATRRHATSPVASVALGRALSGGLLLATEAQSGERVQIQLRGDGPLGNVIVTADSEGTVRGYVQNPAVELPLEGQQLSLARAIGFGTLAVERMHPSWSQPYSGIVPIVAGEIAEDLSLYLLESEQKPSAVVLGIYLGPGEHEGERVEVQAAAGYLLQALPGADDALLAEFEQRVAATAHPSELVRAGASARELLSQIVGDFGHGEVESVEPCFRCGCSEEKVRQAATLLGRDEVRDMVARCEPLEVRCSFCAEVYVLSADAVASAFPDS